MALNKIDLEKQSRWLELVRLWQQSGLSIRAFCRRQRLSEASFYAWRRTLRQRGLLAGRLAAPAGKAAPAFVQVTVEPTNPSATSYLEVVLAKGRRVRVRAGFDPETLRLLLRLLDEERPAC